MMYSITAFFICKLWYLLFIFLKNNYKYVSKLFASLVTDSLDTLVSFKISYNITTKKNIYIKI